MVGKAKSVAKSLSENEKKSPGRSKSPSRQKSPGRSKSPGRPKSPGRTSPSRSVSEVAKRPATPTRTNVKNRSPARVRAGSPLRTSTPIQLPSRRSPIRRSTARATKEPSEEKEKIRDKDIQVKKQKLIIDTDTDSDNPESVPLVKEKPKATVRGRTRKIDNEYELDEKGDHLKSSVTEDSVGLMRRFTRSSQNREIERVVHIITKRMGDFSDEDDTQEKEKQEYIQEYNHHKKYVEFGGAAGALFNVFFIPLSAIIFYVVCDEKQCSFTSAPGLGKYLDWRVFFDAKSFLGIVAYFIVLALLAALPFGGVKITAQPNKQGKFIYVMNGLFSSTVIISLFVALELYGVPIAEYIVKHVFQLLISAIVFAATMSGYLYIRSSYVPVSALNAHVVGKSRIYSFFMGREVNPRLFGSVDLKLLFFRAFIIGAILLDFAYAYKSLDIAQPPSNSIEFIKKWLVVHPTLIVYAILHFTYLMDALIFEPGWTTQFATQQEGFGYLLCIVYSTAPFFYASVLKYILEYNVTLENWKLALVCLNFFFGYVLYRGSNNQKDAFRKNPYNPSLSQLETIPTTQGKKLIVSGFWGIVRHPNYLGDIIIHLSWVPFVASAPPVLTVVQTVAVLIYRAIRDNARCKLKYGAAWDRYRNRVRYALIPKVF